MKEILIIYLNQYIAQFNYLLVRYLHPANHHPPRIKKSVKNFFARELDFKDIKFPIKIRDIHNFETKFHQH